MPRVIQGGLPLAWVDAMSPWGPNRIDTAVLSTSMPGQSTYAGTAPNELVLPVLSTSGARLFGCLQLQHDQFLGSTVAGSGSTALVLSPHIHWTCSTSPSTGTIAEFKLNYVYSKAQVVGVGAGISSAVSAGRFGSTVATSTGRTTMPVSTQSPDFAFRHYITELQDISIQSSLVGPSMMLIYNLQLASSVTTIGQGVMFLSMDVHYQAGPRGTDTEWS